MDARRVLPDRHVRYVLGNAPSLVWLLIVNTTAFLAGVRYYVDEMPEVPTFLWPLFADSPTALALGTLALATMLPALGRRDVLDLPANRPMAYLYTLAAVWLAKYGLWTAVALNLRFDLYFGIDSTALWAYWAIVLTHLGFAVEALMLARVGRTTRGALATALALALANDVFDYYFGYHPPMRYDPGVTLAALTVGLSLFSVWFASRTFRRYEGLTGG